MEETIMDDSVRSIAELEGGQEDTAAGGEVGRFADSYASFTRIINSLQRRYIQLEDDFTTQHRELAEANRRLTELTERNLAVTEFLNGILNSINAGVIAVDRRGVITHFNSAAARILGTAAPEALGRQYRDCVRPGTPPDANALRSVERDEAIDSVERVIEQPDGTRLYLSVSTTILRDAANQSAGAVEVLHDLTKIKRMEQELARLNTLAALGEMAATIAHEVRNPLSGIGGFAALLQKDLDPEDPRYRLVGNILKGVGNLNETVTTLLNYTRFEETNRTEIAYYDFLQGTVRQFERDCSERLAGARIALRPPAEGVRNPRIEVDPMLLRQAYFNLFTNAAEAMAGGGEIEVGYRVYGREEAAAVWGKRLLLGLDETVLETTVADQGTGIAPENLEKIFSPFFTTRGDGNGLGLAVVWKVMKAHGGEVLAENRPAGGALFRLLLPVRRAGGQGVRR
ncbi:MAG TPA: ATP-binding protein [candidate division Zixibacteria bacterium]|nr:PAS domain S-box protein [candidate division Zixibacteria bacterium]MDD4917131.1 ATP-binding protein [candidate division Zixibacteria bacterium]MDM7972685.1 ATP-binding protein [candidate division Zixibacteria bacterium]HOD65399.1 ATP-binding protein [candidate division Zixibacteria bacterium]HPM36162.1 ATP-binding protein [candidate division Zixibacteria bacterium]